METKRNPRYRISNLGYRDVRVEFVGND